ncbi:MAG: hypothetical protein GKR92_13475 [Gammaproteobacteria bacterium]|nr:MAG: hypothetical protein GKR92_00105 [Gammaproteobacteria bacterium]QMU62656.1 MAG: hypothetical protein GKR92_13475 [Gammaproteobacteria bacterium]
MKCAIRNFILFGFFSLTISCGGEDVVIKISDEEIVTGLMNNAPMDNARMHDLLQRVDPELEGELGSWIIAHEAVKAQIITDEKADRMRVIVPIVKVEDIEEGELLRLMQANFDSALDARYSIANGVIWSAFIHPLSVLSDEEFISGLAQAMTAAATFGSTYSSGALIFRGGDSGGQQRDYYESIIEKGLAI